MAAAAPADAVQAPLQVGEQPFGLLARAGRLLLVAAQVGPLGFERRVDALVDGVLALAQPLVLFTLRLVVRERGLKLGAQLLHLGNERRHGVARGVAFDAQRLHFLGRELGAGIRRGRRRRAATREQPDADEQHQHGHGIISHFRRPLLRMAGLLGVLVAVRLRQMHGRVEAVNRRQQRLREAVAARHQVEDGRVLGRAARAQRLVLEGGGEEIALQHARVEVEPAALVLVRRTAVTHWSSRRHDASATARTGSVGISVSRSRSRRRLTRMTPGSGSTVRSGA
jgi:hypothetical protein